MRILIACEESQRVCIAFRKRGHTAFSCDMQDESGGHPEWHIKGDVLPPCTYLTVAANKYYNIEKYGEKAKERIEKRQEAIDFFMKFVNADCDKKCIENPIGVMSSVYKKPSQVIQPFYFGEPERKGTCLWLTNLPLLKPTNIVKPDIIIHKSGRTDSRLHYETLKLPPAERARERSKTFLGVAEAMAEQWGMPDEQLTLF